MVHPGVRVNGNAPMMEAVTLRRALEPVAAVRLVRVVHPGRWERVATAGRDVHKGRPDRTVMDSPPPNVVPRGEAVRKAPVDRRERAALPVENDRPNVVPPDRPQRERGVPPQPWNRP